MRWWTKQSEQEDLAGLVQIGNCKKRVWLKVYSTNVVYFRRNRAGCSSTSSQHYITNCESRRGFPIDILDHNFHYFPGIEETASFFSQLSFPIFHSRTSFSEYADDYSALPEIKFACRWIETSLITAGDYRFIQSSISILKEDLWQQSIYSVLNRQIWQFWNVIQHSIVFRTLIVLEQV